MYCLSNFCFLCLNKDENLLNVTTIESNKSTILEKLLFTIEDLVIVNSKDTKICKLCCNILRVSHEFKKKCLKNNNTFLGYVKQLTEYSNTYAETTVNVDANFIPKSPKNKPERIKNICVVDIVDISSDDDDYNPLNDAKINIDHLIEKQIKDTLNNPKNEATELIQNCNQLKNLLVNDLPLKTPKKNAKSTQTTPPNLQDNKQVESKINTILKTYTEQIKQQLFDENSAKISLKTENISDISDQRTLLFDGEYSNLEVQPLFEDEVDKPLIVVKTEPVDSIPTVETQDLPLPPLLPIKKEPVWNPNIEYDFIGAPKTFVSFADYQNWTQRTKVKTVYLPLEHLKHCNFKPGTSNSLPSRFELKPPKINPPETIVSQVDKESCEKIRSNILQQDDLESLILKTNTEYNKNRKIEREKRRIEKLKEEEIKAKMAHQPLSTIKDTLINNKICELVSEPFVQPVGTSVDFEAAIGSTKIVNEQQLHPILTKLLKKNNQEDITSNLDPSIVLQLEHCYTKSPETTVPDLTPSNKRKKKSFVYNPRRKRTKTDQEPNSNLKYCCHICYLRCGDLHDLNLHMIVKHDGRKLYKCEFCPKVYAILTSLQKHCKERHKVPCSLTDPEIGNVNTSRNEELQAKKVNNPKHAINLYKCNACSKTYSVFSYLQKHCRNEHNMLFSFNDFEMYSQLYSS